MEGLPKFKGILK